MLYVKAENLFISFDQFFLNEKLEQNQPKILEIKI